jgi:hypothetical protein
VAGLEAAVRLLPWRAALTRSLSQPGRSFEVHVISADAYTVDGVRRLAEQGVTDVIVGFRWPYRPGPDPEPLEHKITQLHRFADSVIAKMPG